jgi:hypothetical protein
VSFPLWIHAIDVEMLMKLLKDIDSTSKKILCYCKKNKIMNIQKSHKGKIAMEF